MPRDNGTSMTTAVAVVGGITMLVIAAAAPRPDANAQTAPRTVLDGVFTAAQAERGSEIYGTECSSCHDGADVDGPPLTGSPFIDRWREDSLLGLFEFIRTSMPQTKPGSLSDAAYTEVVAHLLHENAYPAGSRALTMEMLASTLLVGPAGPLALPSGALVRVVGCLSPGPSRDWVITRAGPPSRVRAGNDITATEATAAGSAPLGALTFTLQNVGADGIALPGAGGEGQRIVVKGALTGRAGAGRIHVTAARAVAATCA